MLDRFRWCLTKSGYAQAWVCGRVVYMHRLIVEALAGQHVDHANGDRSDNRRENLRTCTRSQNLANRTKDRDNTSGYKGVFLKRPGRWFSQIGVNGRLIYLGTFDVPQDAAKAYDAAARSYHGDFARTNF